MRRSIHLLVLLAGALLASAALGQTTAQLVDRLGGDDRDARRTAWEALADRGSEAVPAVGTLLASGDPAVRRAAHLALEGIASRASAPGAESERAAVATALVELLGVELPVTEKRMVLRHLSLVAGDECVGAVRDLVRDSGLGDQAWQTLTRIPGSAAREALEALLADGGETALPAADALAVRGEKEAVPALAQALESADSGLGCAVLRALGMLGAADQVEAIAERARDGNPDVPVRLAALDALLRLARAEEAAGRVDEARALYVRAFTLARASQDLALGAVEAVGRLGDDESAAKALIGLWNDDPDLVTACRQTLDTLMPGRWLPLAIQALAPPPYGIAEPITLIARADRETAVQKALEWLNDGGGSWGILGLFIDEPDARAEAPLLATVEQAKDPEYRAVALVAYLRTLDLLGAEGRTEGLSAKYRRALELAEDDATRSAALVGIGGLEDASARVVVEPYLEGEGTRAAALHALLGAARGMAEEGDREGAIGLTRSVLARASSRETRVGAVAVLRGLGIDEDFAAASGFVCNWWILGPIAKADDVGWDVCPEEVLTGVAERPVTLGGAERSWQFHHTTDLDGAVDLSALLDPDADVVAYLHAELVSPTEQDVTLRLGSDDGVAVWVNGQRVHANNAARPVRVDEDTAQAHLRAGANVIVLKISQGGGGWGCCLRVTDGQGAPVVLAMPDVVN